MEAGNDTDMKIDKASHSFQEEETSSGVQFSPPLYLQRYKLAMEHLTRHSIQTVIDFGCSECGFFRLLSTVPSLREIALVDIDRSLLASKTKVISPEVRDYIHRRSNPLNVSMYAGSAGDFDDRMKGYQAVTLIEVIEHLYPDVLESVTRNVFGVIHPQHVVVTTPNSEFNVLFGNEDPQAFRHWDHKFEWSREQFQSWCQSVCNSFGYNVEYTGVGFQPATQNSSDLGPCSQAALFKQREDFDTIEISCDVYNSGERRVYELIAESEFPYDDNKMTIEERLDLEITYILRQVAQLRVEYCDGGDENRKFSIKVSHIANRSSIKHLASLQTVREFLKQKSYTISEDGITLTVNMSDFTNHDDSSDDDSCHANCDDSDDVGKRDSLCGSLNRHSGDSDNWEKDFNLCNDEVNASDWTDTTGPYSNPVETAECEEIWDTPDTAVK